jgi:hypothetical protein
MAEVLGPVASAGSASARGAIHRPPHGARDHVSTRLRVASDFSHSYLIPA